MMKHLLNTGIACAALAVISLATPALAQGTPELGKPAPTFSLSDANGKFHNLADYKGKVVVLEWTNPDCPFVVRHYDAKTMTTLAKKYAAKDVVWLAVNSTHYNKAEDSKKWATEHKFSYPTLLDPKGTVGKQYGAKTTPDMFVINKEGVLVYKGAIDDDPRGRNKTRVNYVDQAVTLVLDGKAPAKGETTPYGCSVKYAKNS